jgi:hypothetical protein
MEATGFMGSWFRMHCEYTHTHTLQCCRNVLVPFPRSVLRHNPVSELYGQFIQPHGLILALICTVNLYRQGWDFPNHVQSIEFTTGGLQSSCRNISRMINRNRIHLSSILRLKAKCLNTYANKVFLVFIFASSIWGIMCRSMRKKII